MYLKLHYQRYHGFLCQKSIIENTCALVKQFSQLFGQIWILIYLLGLI